MTKCHELSRGAASRGSTAEYSEKMKEFVEQAGQKPKPAKGGSKQKKQEVKVEADDGADGPPLKKATNAELVAEIEVKRCETT